MFKATRLKLTAWYLLIIVTVTIGFSSFMYMGVRETTQHALEAQERRLEKKFKQGPQRGEPFVDPETLEEIRENVLITLIFINLAILGISGALGYFLAGKTLKPIEDMLTKQKRFISDAAHELKTPLTAMKTDLEVVLRDKHLSIDESKKVMESTIEEVDRLATFTNRLLSQSKYQNGATNHKENVNLEETLNNSVKKLKSIIQQKHENIVVETKPLNIEGNKESLEELFVNLIDNAIKYSESNKNIFITLKEENSKATIIIKDEGKGIHEDDLPYVFEPFYRSDKSRTQSEINGYGLGLAISKEIVEKHKGTINVDSKINEGTTFTIMFPLVK